MSNATASSASLNEPSSDIVFERSVFYGTIFMMLAYGVCVYMYCHSLILFLSFPKRFRFREQYRLYIIIGTASLILVSIAVFANVVLAQFMWIDYRNFQGGPLGYFSAATSVWWQVLGSATDMTANFIGDALLIYRCYLIWQGNWWFIVFPTLVYLASVAMALVSLVQSAQPGNDFFKGVTVNFGVPWEVLSVTLNVYVTSVIIIRLMRARHQLKSIMPKQALTVYTGVSAVLVESCLPFSVLGVIVAITYAQSSPLAPSFLFVWGVFVTLAPQFIIFRVMNGKSWTTNIMSQDSFGTRNIATRQSGDPQFSLPTSATGTARSTGVSGGEVEMNSVPRTDEKDVFAWS